MMARSLPVAIAAVRRGLETQSTTVDSAPHRPMNYRHVFHAGNFADVFKHIVVARILTHLRRKIAPFRVIDTHAGEGLYDLAGEEANCTGEWRDGVGRLVGAALPSDAAELVARYLLRPQDRLVACELEPRAATALSRHLRRSPTAKVVRVDGWIALKAYVPAKERRGLVIIDPPFEQPDDLPRLADGVVAAHRKWPTGIYLMWYPVKDRDGPDRFIRTLRRAGMEKCLRVEFAVAVSEPGGGLSACGVMVVNPPWKLAAEVKIVAPVLVDLLGRDPGRGYVLDDLAPSLPSPASGGG